MMTNRGDVLQIKSFFKGRFLAEPAAIQEKLFRIKAYVFDWDGVFNSGMKNEHGSSPFSEVDSMGVNMLRFNHYQRTGKTPYTAVITGENNKSAVTLAKREHFDAVFYSVKHKREALDHLCKERGISPLEVACFFDDVLDLAIAEHCGLRVMMGRAANPLLLNLAAEKGFAEYITAADGDDHALREATELLLGVSGRFDDTIMNRVHYSEQYQQYLAQRNIPVTRLYTSVGGRITLQDQ